jgi:hypothetical protein
VKDLEAARVFLSGPAKPEAPAVPEKPETTVPETDKPKIAEAPPRPAVTAKAPAKGLAKLAAAAAKPPSVKAPGALAPKEVFSEEEKPAEAGSAIPADIMGFLKAEYTGRDDMLKSLLGVTGEKPEDILKALGGIYSEKIGRTLPKLKDEELGPAMTHLTSMTNPTLKDLESARDFYARITTPTAPKPEITITAEAPTPARKGPTVIEYGFAAATARPKPPVAKGPIMPAETAETAVSEIPAPPALTKEEAEVKAFLEKERAGAGPEELEKIGGLMKSLAERKITSGDALKSLGAFYSEKFEKTLNRIEKTVKGKDAEVLASFTPSLLPLGDKPTIEDMKGRRAAVELAELYLSEKDPERRKEIAAVAKGLSDGTMKYGSAFAYLALSYGRAEIAAMKKAGKSKEAYDLAIKKTDEILAGLSKGTPATEKDIEDAGAYLFAARAYAASKDKADKEHVLSLLRKTAAGEIPAGKAKVLASIHLGRASAESRTVKSPAIKDKKAAITDIRAYYDMAIVFYERDDALGAKKTLELTDLYLRARELGTDAAGTVDFVHSILGDYSKNPELTKAKDARRLLHIESVGDKAKFSPSPESLGAPMFWALVSTPEKRFTIKDKLKDEGKTLATLHFDMMGHELALRKLEVHSKAAIMVDKTSLKEYGKKETYLEKRAKIAEKKGDLAGAERFRKAAALSDPEMMKARRDEALGIFDEGYARSVEAAGLAKKTLELKAAAAPEKDPKKKAELEAEAARLSEEAIKKGAEGFALMDLGGRGVAALAAMDHSIVNVHTINRESGWAELDSAAEIYASAGRKIISSGVLDEADREKLKVADSLVAAGVAKIAEQKLLEKALSSKRDEIAKLEMRDKENEAKYGAIMVPLRPDTVLSKLDVKTAKDGTPIPPVVSGPSAEHAYATDPATSEVKKRIKRSKAALAKEDLAGASREAAAAAAEMKVAETAAVVSDEHYRLMDGAGAEEKFCSYSLDRSACTGMKEFKTFDLLDRLTDARKAIAAGKAAEAMKLVDGVSEDLGLMSDLQKMENLASATDAIAVDYDERALRFSSYGKRDKSVEEFEDDKVRAAGGIPDTVARDTHYEHAGVAKSLVYDPLKKRAETRAVEAKKLAAEIRAEKEKMRSADDKMRAAKVAEFSGKAKAESDLHKETVIGMNFAEDAAARAVGGFDMAVVLERAEPVEKLKGKKWDDVAWDNAEEFLQIAAYAARDPASVRSDLLESGTLGRKTIRLDEIKMFPVREDGEYVGKRVIDISEKYKTLDEAWKGAATLGMNILEARAAGLESKEASSISAENDLLLTFARMGIGKDSKGAWRKISLTPGEVDVLALSSEASGKATDALYNFGLMGKPGAYGGIKEGIDAVLDESKSINKEVAPLIRAAADRGADYKPTAWGVMEDEHEMGERKERLKDATAAAGRKVEAALEEARAGVRAFGYAAGTAETIGFGIMSLISTPAMLAVGAYGLTKSSTEFVDVAYARGGLDLMSDEEKWRLGSAVVLSGAGLALGGMSRLLNPSAGLAAAGYSIVGANVVMTGIDVYDLTKSGEAEWWDYVFTIGPAALDVASMPAHAIISKNPKIAAWIARSDWTSLVGDIFFNVAADEATEILIHHEMEVPFAKGEGPLPKPPEPEKTPGLSKLMAEEDTKKDAGPAPTLSPADKPPTLPVKKLPPFMLDEDRELLPSRLELHKPEKLAEFARKVAVGETDAVELSGLLPESFRAAVKDLADDTAFKSAAKSGDKVFERHWRETRFGKKVMADALGKIKTAMPSEPSAVPKATEPTLEEAPLKPVLRAPREGPVAEEIERISSLFEEREFFGSTLSPADESVLNEVEKLVTEFGISKEDAIIHVAKTRAELPEISPSAPTKPAEAASITPPGKSPPPSGTPPAGGGRPPSGVPPGGKPPELPPLRKPLGELPPMKKEIVENALRKRGAGESPSSEEAKIVRDVDALVGKGMSEDAAIKHIADELTRPHGVELKSGSPDAFKGAAKDIYPEKVPIYETGPPGKVPFEKVPRAKLLEEIDLDDKGVEMGSSARVYRAEIMIDGKPKEVAVKIFKKGSKEDFDKMLAEYETIEKFISDPTFKDHVPRGYGIVNVDGNFGYALDYVPGSVIELKLTSAEVVRKHLTPDKLAEIKGMMEAFFDAGYNPGDIEIAVLKEKANINGVGREEGHFVIIDLPKKADDISKLGDKKTFIEGEMNKLEGRIDRIAVEDYIARTPSAKTDIEETASGAVRTEFKTRGITKKSSDIKDPVNEFMKLGRKKRVEMAKEYVEYMRTKISKTVAEDLEKSLKKIEAESGVPLLSY